MKKLVFVIIVILAGILALMLFKQEKAQEEEVQVISDWRTYESDLYFYQVSYPPDWVLEPNDGGRSITFSPINGGVEEVVVAIAAPEVEDILRQNLNVVDEKELDVDGRAGTRLATEEEGTKRRQDVVIVEYDGRLYYISGLSQYFDRMLESFKFIINN